MTNGTIPPPQSPRVNVLPTSGNEQAVKIVRLPDALQDVARARRVEGEVVKQNPDGSVRVKTSDGDIDIAVRGRQPQPGQKVEMDIPAGRPPRQAVIRPATPVPAPTAPPPPTETTAPSPRAPIVTPRAAPPSAPPPAQTTSPDRPAIQTPPAAPTAAPARPAPMPGTIPQIPATPPVDASPVSTMPVMTEGTPRPAQGSPVPAPPSLPPILNERTAPVPTLPPQTLSPGANVRLMPLTPMQAQSYLITYTASLTVLPATMARVQMAATIIAQTAVTSLPQNLIASRATPTQTLPAATPATQNMLAANALLTDAPSFSKSSFLENNRAPANILTANTPASAVAARPLSLPAFMPAVPSSLLPATTATPAIIASPLFSASSPEGVAPVNTPLVPRFLDGFVQSILPTAPRLLPPGIPPLPAGTVPQSATPIPSPQPGQIVSQVIGFTPQRLPIVVMIPPGSTTPRFMTLQIPAANIQVGTSIVLTPGASSAPAPAATLALPATLAEWTGLLSWPALDEAVQTLSQLTATSAAALMRTLPNPASPTQMGPAALLFLAAVKAGDVTAWLGERRIDALSRAGKSGLIQQLSNDGATLSRVSSETTAGDWRGVMLPLHWQGEVHKVMLYTRRDGSDSQNDREAQGGGQTRFIFDLSLSRMGDVQIDGLARGPRLDMVVRSQHPFSAPMQAAMRAAYARALEDTPLHGDLTFQGDPRSWINVVKRTETVGVEI